jgi:hypothetical protein
MNNQPDPTDFLSILVSRQEIELQEFDKILTVLSGLIQDNEIIKKFYDRVDIGVGWYNDDKRELWEIPEVKQFFRILDNQWPYWFFFLTKLGSGLKMITFCCIETTKKNETELWIDPPTMENFLYRHFIAMNEVCDRIGMSEDENKDLTNRVFSYFSM